MASLPQVQALTFDLFGTILDLGGSLTPFIKEFLNTKKINLQAENFWEQWRARQRLEQYQDNILALGHSGYLETVRRALVYVMRLNQLESTEADIARLMDAWPHLKPFPEVIDALTRLQRRYRLVVLSNGNPHFLEHLAQNQVRWNFDTIISVAQIGAFKPHPGVYRRAAMTLGLELGTCLMVSANSFDVMGARSCGMRGAYVNRYNLPYEDTPFQADFTVPDFTSLANILLA